MQWGRSLTLQCLIKFPMMRKEKSQLCDTLNPHMCDEEGKICETVTSYWHSLAPHTAEDEEHPSRLDPEFLQSNTKTAQYRATRRPRISRLDRSIANSILGNQLFHTCNTKSLEYRATRRPRISRLDRSIAN